MRRSLRQTMAREDIVALDIGRAQTKCLRLSARPGKTGISFAAVIPTSDLTAEWISANGLDNHSVVAPFAGASLVMQEITLPPMPVAEIGDAILWHLSDITEETINDYVIRFSIIDSPATQPSQQLRVMAYAVHRDEVAQCAVQLQRLRLKPILIEPAVASLVGAWDWLAERRHEGSLLFLDLGQANTRLAIASKRNLLDSRLLEPLPPADPQEGTQSYYRWAVEVQNAIDAYSVNFKDRPITRIYLGGGGANDSALPAYLSENLGIPTVPMDFAEQATLPLEREANPPTLFTTALGVARMPQLEDTL